MSKSKYVTLLATRNVKFEMVVNIKIVYTSGQQGINNGIVYTSGKRVAKPK